MTTAIQVAVVRVDMFIMAAWQVLKTVLPFLVTAALVIWVYLWLRRKVR